MLKEVVAIIGESELQITSGTLFCKRSRGIEASLIHFLNEKGILENEVTIESLDLELSIFFLNTIGYYHTSESFITKNKYKIPANEYYLEDLKSYNTNASDFISNFEQLINFISLLKKESKHHYEEVDIENAILFREDKSSFLPFIYSIKDLESLIQKNKETLGQIISIFNEEDSDKKLLFLNELIDVLNEHEDEKRFSHLLQNLEAYYKRCINAYQFYLRDFSYNKLKLEIDTKALDYTQKIQGVINDAQTRLIAIPTAFLLVITVLDFTSPNSIKNWSILVSLVVFSILIQLFLNNQKSSLNFIIENIKSYKDTFKTGDVEQVSTKFISVDKELNKQKKRLRITQWILWVVPLSILFTLIYLSFSQQLLCFVATFWNYYKLLIARNYAF